MVPKFPPSNDVQLRPPVEARSSGVFRRSKAALVCLKRHLEFVIVIASTTPKKILGQELQQGALTW